MIDRYEVTLWRLVHGKRLGRDVVYVDAKNEANAKRNAVQRARNLRKPADGVTFEAIRAEVVR